MITALLNGQKINCFSGKYDRDALKKWAAKGVILCPACGKPYEYCHGKINSPYFRHKDKAECFDLYSESETEEHIVGKVALYEWVRKLDGITDVVLEGWLPETKLGWSVAFIYGNRIEFFEANNWPMSYCLVENCVYYNNPQRIKTILTDYMHGNYSPDVKVVN